MGGVCTGGGPCDTSIIGTGDNWVTRVEGLPLYIRAIARALLRSGHSEQDSIRLAVGVVKRWAAGEGNVTGATRARAAKAVAEWEAKKAAAHSSRALTEGSSAGALLPEGPTPAQAMHVADEMGGRYHAFRGADLTSCARCGEPINSPRHVAPPEGLRHAGPGHHHVPTGHVADNPLRRRIAAKHTFSADCDAAEAPLAEALRQLFDRQEAATLSRLRGNRGKRMLRSAPPPSDDATPNTSVSYIYDFGFWLSQVTALLTQLLAALGRTAVARTAGHLGLEAPDVDATDAMGTQQAGRLITQMIFDQLAETLADGLSQGEGADALAERVSHTFDLARSRAEMIARTTVVSAYNQAAYAYALSQPPDVVGRKEWLAIHDTRTRPTHRIADGQRVALGMPFIVGGWPMQHPGDPTAPPSELCNCRCTVLYLPAVALASVA